MISYFVQKENQCLMVGLASDQKPTSNTGDSFIESDTGHMFYPNGSGGWTEATVEASAAWGAITGTLADQTDLQDTFNTKAVSSIVVAHVALANPHTQYQMTSSIGTVAAVNTNGNAAQFLNGTGAFSAPAGGSDPWTYKTVSSVHYGCSNTPFYDITGLNFTPGTNSSYEFEAVLMLKTQTATVNPRIQFRWPTNTSSVGWINLSQTFNTQLMSFGNQTSTQNTAVGGLATTTAPWPCIAGGIIKTYGGTTSSFGIMIASETSGTFVSTMIGSFLKYRVY